MTGRPPGVHRSSSRSLPVVLSSFTGRPPNEAGRPPLSNRSTGETSAAGLDPSLLLDRWMDDLVVVAGCSLMAWGFVYGSPGSGRTSKPKRLLCEERTCGQLGSSCKSSAQGTVNVEINRSSGQ